MRYACTIMADVKVLILWTEWTVCRITTPRNLFLLLILVMASLLLDPVRASNQETAIIRAFTERFSRLSGEDLYELWHSDCHRRCRSQLMGHVTLACNFDPYRLTRRLVTKREVNGTIARIIRDSKEATGFPFLSKTSAATFFRPASKEQSLVGHRRKKRGIMDECCYSKSCSWEEFGEYCHTHNRRPSFRSSQCLP